MQPSLKFLARLQNNHLQRIPFSNLEYFRFGSKWIDFNNAFSLIDPVLKGRGGICFHLNYAFYCLLNSIGFHCDLIGCLIEESDIDHMAIVVHLDDQLYYVDVGYGFYFIYQPLPIMDGIYKDRSGIYKVEKAEDHFVIRKQYKRKWIHKLSINLIPRDIRDFRQTYWKHINNGGYLSKRTIFSIYTLNGFIIFSDNSLTIYEGQDCFKYKLPLWRG
ncbi:arylamine N-acetyltransferase [Thermoflavimicrobium daqui]|uniref:arylamine N-acetyltransferase n=1 Tax=Thermoflavimicrobium daqui TaxID=2137476 RepID=UPI0023E8B68A|nr:arylamine N-acetyltransferase [Thermoflavimicrobium daqui]